MIGLSKTTCPAGRQEKLQTAREVVPGIAFLWFRVKLEDKTEEEKEFLLFGREMRMHRISFIWRSSGGRA